MELMVILQLKTNEKNVFDHIIFKWFESQFFVDLNFS